MRQRRMLGALSAAVLISALLTAAGPNNAVATAPQPAGGRPGLLAKEQPRTVTLITGDRVTLHAKGNISVPPRGKVRFLTYSTKDHRYVIPSDALPMLREGRLDRRLFDVTGLLAAGYDRRDTLPLIITGGAPQGFTASRALPVVGGYAFKAGQAQLRDQWRSLGSRPGAKIWLDGIRKPSLDVSVPQIGAPAAWAAGLDGTGVKVAVLDTGIDSTHPDLAGKVAAQSNFTEGEEDDLDHVGHGTHVASTIAGTGAGSNGRYKGVAPGANLLDGKVCVEFGCAESWILAGMQWAAESGARVVNMSLGGGDTPEIDPIEQAVNDLTARYGTLFVIAAGNSGFLGDYSLSSPASADAALAVGAVDKSDVLAVFSSRGPRIGDAGVKPEITAPGVQITAARGKDGQIGEPGQLYATASGTSMATPHVAGSAAILTQQHPTWTADQRKAALTGSANPNASDGVFAQGAGRVDVARAISANVLASPATVGFGVQSWPHEDDPVLSKDIVYRNEGTGDVTLQLALSNPAGGIFSLGASSLTVPAGGSASVKLSADTRQGGSTVGPLGGRVVATADGVRIQTPYGLEREEQKFTIDLIHTDRAGHPAEQYFTVAVNVNNFKDYTASDPDGTAEVKVPAGDYMVFSWVDQIVDGEIANTTMLIQPRLTVASDQTVRLDARTGKPYKVTIPDKTVNPLLIAATGNLVAGNNQMSVSMSTDSFDRIFTAHVGPKPVAGFTSSVQGIWGRRIGERIDPSLLYSLAWQQEGSLYNGFVKDVGKRELVTVREQIANAGPDLGTSLRFPELAGGAWAIGIPMTLPAETTRVINAEAKWRVEFEEDIEDPESPFPQTISFALEDGKVYEAGKTVQEKFNRAVFGPSLPAETFEGGWVSRIDDDIVIFAPVFGDGEGRAGASITKRERTALYRNGELVGEEASLGALFNVPAGNARYRAEMSAERGAPFRLSSNVSVVWSFNSSHVDGIKALPVTAFGFSPLVDDHNVARAGVVAAIPVNVMQQNGSDAKRLKSLNVDVSFDDGKTWREVQVVNLLGHYLVVLKHPSAAGFVSLRARAEDRAGNTVTQTVIRAYQIK